MSTWVKFRTSGRCDIMHWFKIKTNDVGQEIKSASHNLLKITRLARCTMGGLDYWKVKRPMSLYFLVDYLCAVLI